MGLTGQDGVGWGVLFSQGRNSRKPAEEPGRSMYPEGNV